MKLKLVLVDGYWWLGYVLKGMWYPLYRKGRVGDLIQF